MNCPMRLRGARRTRGRRAVAPGPPGGLGGVLETFGHCVTSLLPTGSIHHYLPHNARASASALPKASNRRLVLREDNYRLALRQSLARDL